MQEKAEKNASAYSIKYSNDPSSYEAIQFGALDTELINGYPYHIKHIYRAKNSRGIKVLYRRVLLLDSMLAVKEDVNEAEFESLKPALPATIDSVAAAVDSIIDSENSIIDSGAIQKTEVVYINPNKYTFNIYKLLKKAYGEKGIISKGAFIASYEDFADKLRINKKYTQKIHEALINAYGHYGVLEQNIFTDDLVTFQHKINYTGKHKGKN